MNYEQVVQTNKRQFERTLKVQGQEILNFYKGKTEQIIFGKVNAYKTAQDKLMIYYRTDSSIEKGDVLKYKNYYYVTINENFYENEAWRSATLIKCNTVWNIQGTIVPLVSSDLNSPNPKHGNYMNIVGGSISFFTKDIEALHTKIGIDDIFYDFGGCYKLINKFFVDGLAYLYLQREPSGAREQILVYDGVYTMDMASKSYFLPFYVKDNYNDSYMPTAKLTYTVSDETVAVVNNEGYLIPLKEGVVNITANATGTIENGDKDVSTYNLTMTIEFTITNEMGITPPEIPDSGDTDSGDSSGDSSGGTGSGTGGGTVAYSGIKLTSTTSTIKINGTGKLVTVTYTDEAGVENTDPTFAPVLSYTLYDTDNKKVEVTDWSSLIEQTDNVSGLYNKFRVKFLGDEHYSDYLLLITATYPDGKYGSQMYDLSPL